MRRRIHTREWAPGDPIPNEAELAETFGCARTTMNRALRALADEGLLDRRRKAGTRVALHPVRKATFAIPIVRQEIEELGRQPGYELLSREMKQAPVEVVRRMRAEDRTRMLHVVSLHKADGKPFMFEDRWIDPGVLPAIAKADLEVVSANEWLVVNAPFTAGDISFGAETLGEERALTLGCDPAEATFVVERSTWDGDRAITYVRQSFAPGYRTSARI